MIFKQIPEVLDGTKVETRRLVKPTQEANRWGLDGEFDDRINEVLERRKTPTKYGNVWRQVYGLGNTYPIIPKRGKPAIIDARIRITAIRQERLQDITEEGAMREGVQRTYGGLYYTSDAPDEYYPTARDAYKALWQRINGKTRGARWEDNPMVWVLSFELVNIPAIQRIFDNSNIVWEWPHDDEIVSLTPVVEWLDDGIFATYYTQDGNLIDNDRLGNTLDKAYATALKLCA